jgi:hypothetical protein
MKRTDQTEAEKIIEMINRCEEIIFRAKKTAREIEAKVRRELEALAKSNPQPRPDGEPRATDPPDFARPDLPR